MHKDYDIECLLKDLEVEFLCGCDCFSPEDIQTIINENSFDRGYIEQRLIDRFEEINGDFLKSEGYELISQRDIENQLDIWVRYAEQ